MTNLHQSYSPGNNTSGVSTTTTIRVAFSEEMDRESTNFAFKLYRQALAGEDLVPGNISWQNGDKTLVFTPDTIPDNPGQLLKAITNYRISVSTAAKDKNTNPLEEEGSSEFMTIGVFSLSAGSDNSLLLKDDGTVWSFGNNESGQAGQGPSALHPIHEPGQVLEIENIISVFTKEDSVLTINNNGEVFTWGNYANDVLGYETGDTSQSIPIKVDGIGGAITGAASSSHTVVVVEEDDTTHVYAWGAHSVGRLGNGVDVTTGSTYVPQLVLVGPSPSDPLTDITAVATGQYFTIALDSSGSLWGWGNNSYKELGRTDIPTYIEYAVPLNIGVSEKVIKIAAGYNHSAALLENGTIISWGANASGQLGSNLDITSNCFYPPFYVKKSDGTELSNVVDIVGSGSINTSVLALCDDGTVWAWGYNNNYQLGIGNTETKIHAVQVPGLSSIKDIAIGTNHGLAVNSNGEVFGWGWNGLGQTGINDDTRDYLTTPEKVFE